MKKNIIMNYGFMPLGLKFLTGQALACFLLVLFGVWKIISGQPFLPNTLMILNGGYFFACGYLFLTKWKFSREAYVGIFILDTIFLLILGTSYFLIFVLIFFILLPILWYLFKNTSVIRYFCSAQVSNSGKS